MTMTRATEMLITTTARSVATRTRTNNVIARASTRDTRAATTAANPTSRIERKKGCGFGSPLSCLNFLFLPRHFQTHAGALDRRFGVGALVIVAAGGSRLQHLLRLLFGFLCARHVDLFGTL